MFYVLALALCLAVLFIVLAGTGVVCAAGLWAGRRFLTSLAPRASANSLFVLRTLPLFLAFAVALGFALPAFLRFEPHASGELIGIRLLALATLGALIAAVLMVRGSRIVAATHRAQKSWRAGAKRITIQGVDCPVYSSESGGPLLAVTGIFRPRIFVSRSVVESLSAGELCAAIAHELAHVQAGDNLKQLLLKMTRLPRWFGVFHTSDPAWLNASEMAADEGALSSGASALDLSSALVKVGRLSRHLPATQIIAASHLLPNAGESSIEVRITHLEKLLGSEGHGPEHESPQSRHSGTAVSLLLLLLGYAVCLNPVLPWVHEMLEKLVR